MKRILLGLAVAALAATTASADPGGFAPPPRGNGFALPAGATAPPSGTPDTLIGAISATPTHAPDRYGMLPGLRKLFRLDKNTCSDCNGHKSGCANGGCGPFGHGAPAAGGYGANPPVNQGTLVYPNHPFVRGPRDFFMYEPGR
ncbi:MAG TPA: hypothetical protein VH092_25235 [Urbifossiella sp.]|jgi:hypothetical protein|nr:hypothetical protein [Urbifossiella sp.]